MGAQRMKVGVLFLCLCSTAVFCGKDHKQQIETSKNPLTQKGEGSVAKAEGVKQSVIKNLKNSDEQLKRVIKDASKISSDTLAVEDQMWSSMKGQNNRDSLLASAKKLKQDAAKMDVYGHEKKAIKSLGKAKKALDGDVDQKQIDATLKNEDAAVEKTKRMAHDFNAIQQDANKLTDIPFAGMDPTALPTKVKINVDRLNRLRTDAAQVAKVEQASLDADKKFESNVQELA